MAHRKRIIKQIRKVVGLVLLLGFLVLVGGIVHSCIPSERMAGDALLEDRGSGAARQRYTGHLTELDLAEDGDYEFHLEDLPTPGGSINQLVVGFSVPMTRREVLGQDLGRTQVEVLLRREGRGCFISTPRCPSGQYQGETTRRHFSITLLETVRKTPGSCRTETPSTP